MATEHSTVSQFLYAYDMVLISDSVDSLQRMVNAVLRGVLEEKDDGECIQE